MRRGLHTLALIVTLALGATPIPASATPPGENGLIVFAADTGDGYELYTIGGDGSGLTQITDQDEGDAVTPDWSPDGTRIAFALERPEGPEFCAVMIMDADGSDIADLTAGQNPDGWSGCEGQPSFTPDGERIVFGRYDDQTNVEDIWSMDLTGGDRVAITDGNGHGVTDPNVSPDGERVSFVEFNGEELGQALAAVDMDGTAYDRLTRFKLDVATKHDWAPNGRRIVFTVNADRSEEPANIATIRPDGSSLRYLTGYVRPSHRAYVGGYSPDGQWIVFRLEIGDRSGLFRMHRDGTGRETLIPLGELRPRFIDWGPTG